MAPDAFFAGKRAPTQVRPSALPLPAIVQKSLNYAFELSYSSRSSAESKIGPNKGARPLETRPEDCLF